MAGKVTGIVYITVNDNLLQSMPGATLLFGGLTRTPQSGHDLYGSSAEYTPAEVECVVADKYETDIIALCAYEDSEVTFESDVGKRYLITAAFTSDPCKLSDGGGGIALKMIGKAAVKQ